jgi:hypothetical protein
MKTQTKSLETVTESLYHAWAAMTETDLTENDLLDSDAEPETDPYVAALIRRLEAEETQAGNPETLADAIH